MKRRQGERYHSRFLDILEKGIFGDDFVIISPSLPSPLTG
jgi:hypothetical protein